MARARDWRKNRQRILIAVMGYLALLGLASLAPAEQTLSYGTPVVDPTVRAYVPANGLSGRITIAGSKTMQPMLAKLAADFMRQHPDVNITIEAHGSRAGIREFALGISLQRRGDKARKSGHNGADAVNMLASSRPLTDSELGAFSAHHGYAPLGLPIAMDAITVYVNAQNPLQGLTLEQAEAIFCSTGDPASHNIATWGEAGGPSWLEKKALHLYGRNKDSATREFFIQAVCRGRALKEEIHEQPGNASIILAIARDPLGIGYTGTVLQTSYVRAVPLAARVGRPFIMPTRESVLEGTYPLRRYLYLYASRTPETENDSAITEFLKFANSQEGQRIVRRTNFFPLTDAMHAKNMELLNERTVMADLSSAVN